MKQPERYIHSLTPEGRARLLVEAVTDYAIYMLTPDGFVSSWNPGAKRLKGYDADEVVGMHFGAFYGQEDRAAGVPENALRVAAEKGRVEMEGWRLRKDGSRFWALVVIDAIRGPDGELVGFAKVTRDLTERREAQLALEQAREALQQSQKLEAIGQLTGGIAHDFNNLLMAILSSLELAKRRLGPQAGVTNLLDNAERAARRGVSLTERMLSFARRKALTVTPIDLSQLIHDMRELLERALGPSVEIDLDVSSELQHVLGDADQLELAILNLAVNGRDAMPEGGTIRIGAKPEELATGNRLQLPPGHYVCLSVADQGEGMDSDTLSRAVEPFFTTKGVGKGTGLGLSMVDGMAAQCGGRLTLTSQKGAGTTASICLPVAPLQYPEASEVREPVGGTSPARNLRILAVDDDAIILLNTSMMIEELGHQAIEANSGAAALTILKNEIVDLLITDHAMPQMTGLQLAARARELRPDLPIILATGYVGLAGADDIVHLTLPKPFTIADLAGALAEVSRA